MIKTPLSTVIGGAFWTPKATILGSASKTFEQLIKSIFANNEQGFAYDPNDMSTMFQDAAGVTPVTGVGQPVGLIKDKSGRGNHAMQTVSASRPILRQNATTGAYYLEFDGSDDFLQTNNIDFTGTDKVSLFAGVRNYATSTVGVLTELSSSADSTTNTGSFYLAVPSVNNFRAQARGTSSTASFVFIPVNSAAKLPSIFTAKYDLANKVTLRLDSSQTEGVGLNVQGRFNSYPLYIGRRGGTSLPFNGHIYGLIGIGKLTSDSETAAIEKELAKRVGVALNV